MKKSQPRTDRVHFLNELTRRNSICDGWVLCFITSTTVMNLDCCTGSVDFCNICSYNNYYVVSFTVYAILDAIPPYDVYSLS